MQVLEWLLKKYKYSHNHLLVALKYRYTSIGYNQSIDVAILAMPDDSTKKYMEWIAENEGIISCICLVVVLLTTTSE